jgi:hypothetical protein
VARFNTTGHRAKPAVALTTSPIATVTKQPNTRTFEGAAGWTRTPQAELFLRATGAFHGGEGTFYESADKRDDRLRELVREVAIEDPSWCFQFARWLRSEGNMRTAALMFAVEFVYARLSAGQHGCVGAVVPHPDSDEIIATNRRIITAVCQRADEPGELLAIWTTWYGRRIPKPVKRGIADAVCRLYNEHSLLKYDTDSHAYRFADVLNLVHPTPSADKPWQGDLFQYALNRRHHPENRQIPLSLTMVVKNEGIRRNGELEHWLNPDLLRAAGLTWEDALSAVGNKVDKAKLWEALIPSMGIMAQLRNLRNFDQAGVSDAVAQQVIARLTDPQEIAKSRQLPFRFLAAYRATKEAGSLRWAYPLEQALNHSLANVPALPGRTLILVDRSPSMFPNRWSYTPSATDKRLGISRADQAAIFGSALALRAENPTLVEFGGTSRVMTVNKGMSVLPLVDQFGEINATDIPSAVRSHYAHHDRVVIITDEQTRPGYLPSNAKGWQIEHTAIDSLVPRDVPVFMWNLAGYTASATASGSNARFTLGGLTDQAFTLIPMLESGAAGVWPWEANHGD